MVTQRTFLTSNKFESDKHRGGFTLIEVMVVLAILAALVAVGAPRMFKKDGNIKNVARNVVVVVKEIRNHARLFNSTYRLAIRMEPGNEAYWVEKGNGPILLDPEKLKKELENKKLKDRVQNDKDAPPPLFQPDKRILKEEKRLPPNLHFSQVETLNLSEPITSGLAYIHFFPEGMMEAAAIQISDDRKNTWTLVFNPLTGQADIIEKATTLKGVER